MRLLTPRIILTAALIALAAAAPASERRVPYWASISAGDALLRTGPGRNYPSTWRYRRADLPVIVLQVHESWRRIRDHDGTEGWMAAVLLSAERTAMIVGRTQAMRGAPDQMGRLLWRVEPGVVGRIRHCSDGWCEFTASGKVGYVEVSGLWGVSPREEID